MICDGNCNSKITDNLFNCATCNKNFCSDVCSIEHIIENHKKAKKPDYKDYYDFSNFEKIRRGSSTYVLGTGAFGEVYLARNKVDNKLYAIKHVDKSKLMAMGIRPEQILHEIKIHMKLIHENITRLYSYHENNEAYYLIMEYAEKGTLFNYIQSTKGMSEERAFKYFIQVANAVYFLHNNNLMHRDLKPENCLIDSNDNIKLCDFGWTVECNRNRSTFCGTYEYMAPEIIKELPYNRLIDSWSLGILLYEMIHSYSPFRAKFNENESNVQVLKNIIKNHVVIEKNISDECRDIITKLLAPNIEGRMSVSDIFTHPWVCKYLDKSKDTTLDTLNTTFSHNTSDKLFDMVLNRIIQKKNSKNKIVVKVQAEKKHKPTSSLERISPIKEINEESNSMLKDLREIGKQIESNNKRFDLIHMKTSQLKEKIEKSILTDSNYNNEIYKDKSNIHRRSSFLNSSSQNYRSKLIGDYVKNECSTQTESGDSAWSKFFKLFRCSS